MTDGGEKKPKKPRKRRTPAAGAPVEAVADASQPVEAKAEEPKPEERKPEEAKPEEPKPEEPKPEAAAAPEKVALADTASFEAVPVAVERVNASAVAAPVEISKTAPITAPIAVAPEELRPPAPPSPSPSPEPVAAPAASDEADMVGDASIVLSDEVLDGSGFSPDFMLADEAPELSSDAAAALAPPPAPTPLPPILPSPAEAALQAARIVSQMVDIDSESGAVIAATAAAGAAITAAVAAKGALPETAAGHDPVTTVKLSRERILRALEQEPSATAAPAVEAKASSSNQALPASAKDDQPYEDFDPVAIAAAAISRLRARARTDLAELRVHYHRHDIVVLIAAFVIIVVVGRVHKNLVTPANKVFSDHGLTFEHAAGWLGPDPLPPVTPRLVHDINGGPPPKDPSFYRAEITAPEHAKIEVLIDKKPSYLNIVTGLELDRRNRFGEQYAVEDSHVESISGHDWLRTAYRYGHAEKDVPRVDRAIEYATIDRDQIYVLTFFGTPGELERIEDVVAPSLQVASQTGVPLLMQTSRVAQHKFPPEIMPAFKATTMIVVADLVDGRLRARGGGSGIVVGSDGSILTNYHVIHDKDGRLHDVFVVARLTGEPDRPPQIWCAGRPSRSKLQAELDLALIKCDMDLDGRTWNPSSTPVWSTLPPARAADVKMGQRLWVLGFPDVGGGGGLTLSQGEVEGWTGVDGTTGRDFIKTDASITRGNSGGPVVDDQGRLVGIASAFRTKVNANGSVIETAQVGLVRPLGTASCLLDVAATGWTPREGHPECDLAPTGVEAAAEGIRIYTTVVDDANDTAIGNALVMVLKPGIARAQIDTNRLDDQVIAWGRTNAEGEVRLKQLVPVPGTYTVMVVAPGYERLIGENELHLDANTKPSFDPWGKIGLHAR